MRACHTHVTSVRSPARGDCTEGKSWSMSSRHNTMAANGSGLQMATVRNLLMAWVLTLPMAILLSGTLYWIFSHIF